MTTTIIIAIATFILGYVTGVYLPQKFRKEDKTPKISIGPLQGRQNYFDITNHGGDILNLEIEISWLQEGKKEKRKMEDFFNKNEDPALRYPHKCNSLKKGETKKVTNCPMYSDNSKVKVVINGEDVTGKKYNNILTLENNIKS